MQNLIAILLAPLWSKFTNYHQRPVGIFLASSYSDLYCSIKDEAWRRDVGVIVHPKLRK